MEQLERIPKHEATNDETIATADIIFLSLSSFNAGRELNVQNYCTVEIFLAVAAHNCVDTFMLSAMLPLGNGLIRIHRCLQFFLSPNIVLPGHELLQVLQGKIENLGVRIEAMKFN